MPRHMTLLLVVAVVLVATSCGKSEEELAQSREYLSEATAGLEQLATVASAPLDFPRDKVRSVVENCSILAQLDAGVHEAACSNNPLLSEDVIGNVAETERTLYAEIRAATDLLNEPPTVGSLAGERIVQPLADLTRQQTVEAVRQALLPRTTALADAVSGVAAAQKRFSAATANLEEPPSFFALAPEAVGSATSALGRIDAFSRAAGEYDPALAPAEGLTELIGWMSESRPDELTEEARANLVKEFDNEAWRDASPEPSPLVDTVMALLPRESSEPAAPAAPTPARIIEPRFGAGDEMVVEIVIDPALAADMTSREKEEQRRDLIFEAALSALNVPIERIRDITEDMIPMRSEAFIDFGRRETGPMRWGSVSETEMVVLLPADLEAPAEQSYLANAADAHRMRTGAKPQTITLVAYRLLETLDAATMQNRGHEDGLQLFSRDGGYVERTVRGRADLEGFLSEVDDLTYARFDGDALILGGRDLPEREGMMTLEDVAAIWQAGPGPFVELQKVWIAKAEALERKMKEEQDAFNRESKQLNDVLYQTCLTQSCSQSQYEQRFEALQEKRERDWKALEEQVNKTQKDFGQAYEKAFSESAVNPNIGFSLDPETDYAALGQYLDTGFSEVMANFEREFGKPLFEPEAWQRARAALDGDQPDLTPLYELIYPEDAAATSLADLFKGLIDIQPGDGPQERSEQETEQFLSTIASRASRDLILAMLRGEKLAESQFQAARYDGDLRGTEVGMTLFYTDLLAKLWALDFAGSAPDFVEDFPVIGRNRLSSVHQVQIIKLPSTRLWFGLEPSAWSACRATSAGFCESTGGDAGDPLGALEGGPANLFFERSAARIFAASSHPRDRGEEQDPNVFSKFFLKWWDDHYSEIARIEPQYERLNQILKWATVLGVAADVDRMEVVAFLDQEPVTDDAWFPDWAAERGQSLQFDDWQEIDFIEGRDRATETEALPLLTSEPFTTFEDAPLDAILRGGVSALELQKLSSKPLISSRMDAAARRGDSASVRQVPGGEVVEFADGRTYGRFRERSSITVGETKRVASRTTRYGAHEMNIAHQGVAGGAGGRRTTISLDGAKALERSVRLKRPDVLRVALNADSHKIAEGLARRLGEDTAWTARLLEDRNVRFVIFDPAEHRYYVQLYTKEWYTFDPRLYETAMLDPAENSSWTAALREGAMDMAFTPLSRDEMQTLLREKPVLALPRDAEWRAKLMEIRDEPDPALPEGRFAGGGGGGDGPPPRVLLAAAGPPDGPRRPSVDWDRMPSHRLPVPGDQSDVAVRQAVIDSPREDGFKPAVRVEAQRYLSEVRTVDDLVDMVRTADWRETDGAVVELVTHPYHLRSAELRRAVDDTVAALSRSEGGGRVPPELKQVLLQGPAKELPVRQVVRDSESKAMELSRERLMANATGAQFSHRENDPLEDNILNQAVAETLRKIHDSLTRQPLPLETLDTLFGSLDGSVDADTFLEVVGRKAAEVGATEERRALMALALGTIWAIGDSGFSNIEHLDLSSQASCGGELALTVLVEEGAVREADGDGPNVAVFVEVAPDVSGEDQLGSDDSTPVDAIAELVFAPDCLLSVDGAERAYDATLTEAEVLDGYAQFLAARKENPELKSYGLNHLH